MSIFNKNAALKKYLALGFLITVSFFIIHLAIINDYGLSWDFHSHLYAGLHHLGIPYPSQTDVVWVPFKYKDPSETVWQPYGPLSTILPTLTYILMYRKLALLPFDSAYNFASVLFGVLGIAVLFYFLYESRSFTSAIFGSLFLGLLPVYFSYLHYNMKDVPNAVAFALAIYLFWRFSKRKSIKALLLAVVSFAFAFNVKVNSIFIIPITFSWVVISYVVKMLQTGLSRITKREIFLTISYFILGPLAALSFWWPFWQDPLNTLLGMKYFFSHITLNMPVLFWGEILYSGVNIPWYYPYVYLAVTTPIPIILSFLTGLIICLKDTNANRRKISLLFILWFFIPLARFVIKGNSAIDGVRHFMEVVFPLCAVASVGAEFIYIKVGKTVGIKTAIILSGVVFLFLLKNIIVYHPYQTSFFNAAVGGIKGAEGKFDLDFWGTPQKEAVIWLNKNAPFNSYITIPLAMDSNAVYLRPDLKQNVNIRDIAESDYTVILNRESFLNEGIIQYRKGVTSVSEIVYTREVEGASLVWVYKNKKI